MEHIADNYNIYEILGTGMEAVIYRAVNKQTKETVALKKYITIYRDINDTYNIYKKLMDDKTPHPSILRINRIFKAIMNNKIYNWMELEYLKGYHLYEIIEKGNIQIKPKCARVFLIYLLEALDYIEQKGYHHIDLNANIMFTTDSIKIIDLDALYPLKKTNPLEGMTIGRMILLLIDKNIDINKPDITNVLKRLNYPLDIIIVLNKLFYRKKYTYRGLINKLKK